LHVYHSYLIVEPDLVLEVAVASEKAHAAKHAMPGLRAPLDRLEAACAPTCCPATATGARPNTVHLA
jgi:hypothetical protein